MRTDIDVTFDFRWDTPRGKDPDTHSKTLRRYHKLLWSKPLPGGEAFELDDTTPGSYLHHRSTVGEFWLASDAVIPTFKWAPHLKSLIPVEEFEAFNAVGYTIGGMMVFPANQILISNDPQPTERVAPGAVRSALRRRAGAHAVPPDRSGG
jgi:hypothetical protein